MKELICIVCPVGCHLNVEDKDHITGNKCPRGLKYAIDEITHPVRTITTTIKTTSFRMPRVPVKTSQPIPKELIFKIMDEIGAYVLTKSVKMNDIIIENILDTKVDIVATRDFDIERN